MFKTDKKLLKEEAFFNRQIHQAIFDILTPLHFLYNIKIKSSLDISAEICQIGKTKKNIFHVTLKLELSKNDVRLKLSSKRSLKIVL
jgi:hypothetical protein